MQANQSHPTKAYKGMAMEGVIARWYSKNREHDTELEQLVYQLREVLPAGSRVLEVAPGPGYLAVELAKHGYQVTGLDISHTFVEIASTKARQAGVKADFQQGNASRMPFASDTFDLIVCRAAFKNFTEPVLAIREMHRVLKVSGKAVIIDLRGDASVEDIRAAVKAMNLGAVNGWLTRMALSTFLLKNAYTPGMMRQMVSLTSFGSCDIVEDPIGMQVWMEK